MGNTCPDGKNAEYDYNLNEKLECYRRISDTGLLAQKSAMIINAGAAVALIAFYGNIINKCSFNVNYLAYSLFSYGIGVFTAALTNSLAFFLQQKFYEEISRIGVYTKSNKPGRFLKLSIILCTISFLSFLVGCICLGYALMKHPPSQ